MSVTDDTPAQRKEHVQDFSSNKNLSKALADRLLDPLSSPGDF
jgi:hypothetical protein